MSLKRLLGIKPEDDTGVRLVVSNVALPLDMAIQLIFRQQSQLFEEHNDLRGQIGVAEAILTQMGEKMAKDIKHVHNDIIQTRQAIEGLSDHPESQIEEDEPQQPIDHIVSDHAPGDDGEKPH